MIPKIFQFASLSGRIYDKRLAPWIEDHADTEIYYELHSLSTICNWTIQAPVLRLTYVKNEKYSRLKTKKYTYSIFSWTHIVERNIYDIPIPEHIEQTLEEAKKYCENLVAKAGFIPASKELEILL